jgi:hypothetical protein
MNDPAGTLRTLRFVLGFFIVALVVSGITAFPLAREMEWLVSALGLQQQPTASGSPGGPGFWIRTVHDGLNEAYAAHPWIAYGTDWLAFAHIIIAVFFIGPFIDPVRNVWVIKAGLIACGLVVPPAIVCGAVRGIPVGWRLIDCSFGVIGAVPLYYCLRLTKTLEKLPPTQQLR